MGLSYQKNILVISLAVLAELTYVMDRRLKNCQNATYFALWGATLRCHHPNLYICGKPSPQ